MSLLDLFDLTGKVAIVTGGGSGIGLQFAEALAEMHADVVVCSRDGARCEEAARELSRFGGQALGLRCDVRSESEIASVVETTLASLGRIDILVNNSGTVWAEWPEATSLPDWQKVIDVNLTGVFLFSRAVGRTMIESGGGRIINIASVAGFRGAPPALMNAISYQTSKAAVIAFTRDLACKWARHGINVNAIAPGWFPSEMTAAHLEAQGEALLRHIPLRRFGGPEDLKGGVVYLASAASSYVTGTTLVIDGGQLAW